MVIIITAGKTLTVFLSYQTSPKIAKI